MSLSKEMSAITECSICKESFVNPRILPCVHTFCLQCLESSGKTQKPDGKVTCPLCRETFQLPSKKLTDLPVNFFIQKLLEVRNITKESHENFCGACYSGDNTTTNAVVHCFDCRQNLCGKCLKVHNNLAYARSHQVVEFGNKTAEELLKVAPSFCDCHPDELVKFFCSDCQATICMTCYVEGHSSHKCANIVKVSEEFLRELKEDASKVARHIENCLSEDEKLQIKKEEFLQDMKKKESLVQDTLSGLEQLLDAYGKQILVEMKSVKEVKLKEFETTKNEIHDRLLMMESFKAYTDEVSAKATPADITRLAPMLRQRATELHAIRLDNDLCVFDVDINLSHLTRLLSQKLKSTAKDIGVYRNRRGVAEPYFSPSLVIIMPTRDLRIILGMTGIKQEMYLLTKSSAVEGNVQKKRKEVLIGAYALRLLLPTTFTFIDRPDYTKPETRSCAKYTDSDAILCHLQLWYCGASATVADTLKLRISSLSLIESEGNAVDRAHFDLGQYHFGQPLQEDRTVTLQSPTKLSTGGARFMVFKFKISRTMTNVAVEASISELNSIYPPNYFSYTNTTGVTAVYPVVDPSVLNLQTYSKLPSLFALEVHDVESVEPSPHGITKTLGNAIMAFMLPNNSTPSAGIFYSQTRATKYEYILLLLELIYTESSSTTADKLTIQLSNLIASESHVGLTQSSTFDIEPYRLGKDTILDQNITFKTSPNLIKSGFDGVQVKVQVKATVSSVTIAISEANFTTTQGDYVTEAKIDIPTHARMESLTLRREIRLPSSIDPSCMTSCSYHECIYIGDCQSPSILRIEPTGKMSTWTVSESPSGLSVSPSHNLIVTFNVASRIREYTTFGVPVRDIQLTGVSDPKVSLQITKDKFLLLTGTSPMVGATTPIFLVTTLNKPNPKDEGYNIETVIRLSEAATERESVASNRVSLCGDSGRGIDISSWVAQEIKTIPLNGPIQAVVDHFGFILILTMTDSTVHLLDPELNYVGEAISLCEYKIPPQSNIYFEQNSGRLYVTSEYLPHIMAFQITEGRVDPSIWKNDL